MRATRVSVYESYDHAPPPARVKLVRYRGSGYIIILCTRAKKKRSRLLRDDGVGEGGENDRFGSRRYFNGIADGFLCMLDGEGGRRCFIRHLAKPPRLICIGTVVVDAAGTKRH